MEVYIFTSIISITDRLSANDKQGKNTVLQKYVYMILRRKRICLFIKHLYNNDLHNHKFNTLL